MLDKLKQLDNRYSELASEWKTARYMQTRRHTPNAHVR